MSFEFERNGVLYRFHTEVAVRDLKDTARSSHPTRCVLEAKDQEEASMEPQDETN